MKMYSASSRLPEAARNFLNGKVKTTSHFPALDVSSVAGFDVLTKAVQTFLGNVRKDLDTGKLSFEKDGKTVDVPAETAAKVISRQRIALLEEKGIAGAIAELILGENSQREAWRANLVETFKIPADAFKRGEGETVVVPDPTDLA